MILAREVSRPKLKVLSPWISTSDLAPTSRGTLRQEFRSHKAPQVEVPVGDKIEIPKYSAKISYTTSRHYQHMRFAQKCWCIELVKPGTGVQRGELIVLIGDQLQVILVVPHWR